MFGWFLSAGLSVGALLGARWAMGVSTPRRDWWHLQRWAVWVMGPVRSATSRLRVWLLDQAGVTRANWWWLRRRVTRGEFGEQGT